jgi:Mor family transcriptional regulator
MSPDINISLLPKTLQEIAQEIGISDTLKLVRHYGGTSVYIPRKLKTDHELIAVLGLDSAIKICEKFGGYDRIEIPKAQMLTLELRNIEILNDKKTLSRSKVARKYGLTERQISKILHRNKHSQVVEHPTLF